MDKSHAQFVLHSHRPGGADAADPAFAGALAEVSRDTALAEWFEGEQQMDRAIAARLKSVPVPPDLADSILAGLQAGPPIPRRRAMLVPLALAASIAVLATCGFFWLNRARPNQDFAQFRQEMVERLDSRLVLNLQSDQAAVLQQWLAERSGLAGSVIPAGLQGRSSIGCRSWMWNGQPAGLICFVLEGGDVVHLFIVPRQAVPAAPAGVEAQFQQVGTWQTASWSRDELVYVLAGRTDREALARLL